ncbi:C40 family peptidase [Phocaeicola barnesiae]|jgi:cell wall-associated NlpC family hydrolase|uniref:C40 family peptidase n=1 Tax=Phocaeicola barnesiae TaxID=376804 RepID=UPI00035DB60B|nr:C40 family peptidase [Phocaeicola barnesiae]MCF2577475.1 C40 family peptidase [Phocaeicola barnesiae]MDM8254338.1 C40 family peptidase [Phocaeicola barnesiae]MDM8256794.1 C40 family peptidase [Phocaeicola barnesiae]MDM8308471.1 C40 family peptidase [Phocaeicola barnesiae]HJG77479.1 C40 family peptidase [Phocaeicola barnesiae]
MRYVIATLLFCLAGIFSLPLSAQTSTSADSTSVTGHDIVKVAMKYIGVPYRSGRMNPKVGFDCSGFTTYVFKKENIQLTRSSRSQFTEGVEVSSCTDLQKGDLVFFGGSRSSSTSIGHVGIVTDVNPSTGTFSFIHASRTGIRISSSDEPYYAKRYVGARRILLS